MTDTPLEWAQNKIVYADLATTARKYRKWFEDVDQALTLEEQENIKLKAHIHRLEKALIYHSGLNVNSAIRQAEEDGEDERRSD